MIYLTAFLHSCQPAHEYNVLIETFKPAEIGFVVGKSGAAIKTIQAQTGTAIKVLPKSELPACAWVSDEVLKISGPCQAVHAALMEVAKVLERHPPRHRPGSRQGPMLLAQASTGDAHFMGPTAHTLLGHHGLMASHAGSLLAGHAIETVFRLLAPVAKVGNIIGRNGDHVRKVRLETGARVKIYDGDEEAEERLVCVLSTEEVLSQYCAAQDALVRCAMCLNQPEEGQHRVRLLVPQTAIGAVLGKKGQTIMQLRQETGAAIRVHPTDAPIAACAASAHGGGEPGGDEIIQIDGSLPQTIAALRGVATLLRGWQIRRALTAPPLRSAAPTSVAMSPQPLTTPLVTLAGAPPASAVATLCHPPGSIVAIPIHSQPLPMQMQMQMQMPLPLPLAIHHHHQLHGGLYGASQPPQGVNMNMNVNVNGGGGGGGGGVNSASAGQMLWRYRLTNVQAGAVIGKAGHHVTQIRVLTGARVHLPGDHNQFVQSSSTDGLRTLEISGSLEACQAAHSLVNQFLALGQCAPAMPELLSGTSAGLSSSNLGSPRDPQQPPTYVVA
jgi:transcription antitermination factor NusA-like protein